MYWPLLPLPLVLTMVGAGMMLVPAAYAVTLGDHFTARAFFYPALFISTLALFFALALMGRPPPRNRERSLLRGFVLSFLVLPCVLALPLSQALPGVDAVSAWFEMVSSLTTTGATLLDPASTPAAVHLWRGLVGWWGGFLILVAAAGILAPLNLGGFEIYAPRAFGQSAQTPIHAGPARDPYHRLVRLIHQLWPIYVALTGALWVVLLMAGDRGLVAVMHAMGAISTSGITPLPLLAMPPSGMLGELAVAMGMGVAISRRFLPLDPHLTRQQSLWRDPEIRLAASLVGGVVGILFLRHWISSVESVKDNDLWDVLHGIWGAAFTTLSYLTTTGYTSAGWEKMGAWSGMNQPGLLLLGLSIVGGGVATAAGGITLLRVHALFQLVGREMERLSDPSSVGGGGPQARLMRHEGAFIAFTFFMIFALSLGAVQLILAALGLPFERSLALAIAALSTAGPLAEASGLSPRGWQDLGVAGEITLGLAMILGRLEALALLALLMPASWRR